jgi:hypothetical protein
MSAIKPTCCKCGHTDFVVEEIGASNATLRMPILLCANCGVVVGIPSRDAHGALSNEIRNLRDAFEHELKKVTEAVNQLRLKLD